MKSLNVPMPHTQQSETPRTGLMAGALWLWEARHGLIAALALVGMALHLLLRFAVHTSIAAYRVPLLVVLIVGGTPLVLTLGVKLFRRQFGSDLLAGMSIVTCLLLDEYLAGALVVLMLSGGEALEAIAVQSASSVLRALAKRMPSVAHRAAADGTPVDVAMDQIQIADTLLVFPHEICPVDGVVTAGHGTMDESYLTGEPFQMSKVPGSEVISGAINGESAITIRATRLAVDSRYSKIMQVMRNSEKDAPHLRRLGDQLGAFYTPLALAVAIAAWLISGHANRFLAVLVVATPCPLLIAIPTAIIGSISLCARRGIIVKKSVVLEQVEGCRTLIFDKTGTLTYGEPRVSEINLASGLNRPDVLGLLASAERFSKHPLARAILRAAKDDGVPLQEVSDISERSGEGLRATIGDLQLQICSRKQFIAQYGPDSAELLSPMTGGLECVVTLNGNYAATVVFRDEPRSEGAPFIRHLSGKHQFHRLMLVSGDRESEVQYLARQVGITEVFASQSPEQKLEIVRKETKLARTLYLGDGINDAPALMAATVGVAMGQNSDVTTEAAGAVIMDSSLSKVDEFLHISRRMRNVALQSAIGGMALSLVGMILASFGYLPPVAGAVAQELIDVAAVLNALRAAMPPKALTDF